jgi:hypothetical protein
MEPVITTPPVKKKKKNYLNNADMLVELKKSRDQEKLTEEMGNMFMMLVKRYASIPRFSGYSYNDEMQGFALFTLVKVWRGFDGTKYFNPFAYFTQIVHNAFHQLDNLERRQRDIRDAILVDQGKNPSYNYSERANYNNDESGDSYGDMDYMEVHDTMEVKFDSDIEDIVEEIKGFDQKPKEEVDGDKPTESKESDNT